MKKFLFLLIALTVSAQFIATAQSFLGTKSLYNAPATTPTTAPKGYEPVFINHVGRHGARHLTKEVNTSYAYAILTKADSLNALTSNGKVLLQMVKALAKVEKGKVKSISAEGVEELQGIGERMQAYQAAVFAKGANLNVTETKEIRTKQSANAFLSGFKKHLTKEPVIKEYIDDTSLRFYDFSPVYKQFEEDGEWVKYRKSIASQLRLEMVNDIIVARFLSNDLLKTLTSANRDKLVSDVFGFAAITYSLKHEIKEAGFSGADVNFIKLFTPKEISVLSALDVADDYYQKGPGIDANGIQSRIAAPLLVNFINTTDEFMKTGTYNTQLRFAHAETISPFATLLGISIADKNTKTTNIEAYWQSANIIPLSSNIQWIFYKNMAGNYLVKILLNERNVHITGLATNTYPFYSWAKLREFYMDKLQKLHVGLTDDMNSYLQSVK
jgi:multiple inositol-polyphosphate phosphatase/2,3-bisphosphoglycerate 3-phosphatase